MFAPDNIDNSQWYEADDGERIYGPVLDGVRYIPYAGAVEGVLKMSSYPIDEGDIVLSSFPKSGTNWVMNIIKFILLKEELKRNPNLELPGNLFAEMTTLDKNSPTFKMKCGLISTHVLPRYLPTDLVSGGKGSLIYVTRNPKDTIVSYYHFMKSFVNFSGSFASFYRMFMDGQWYYGDWFTHAIAYNEFVEKNKDRYLVVNYEEMKRRPRDHVQSIARHIGHPLSEDDVDFVLEMSSVDKMKERMSRLPDVHLKPFREAIYRKGEIGDWKNYFTVAMDEHFNAEYKQRLAGTNIERTFVY